MGVPVSFCAFMPSRQGSLTIPAPKSRGNGGGGSILGKAANPRRADANGVPALVQAQAPRDACANPCRAPLIQTTGLVLPSQPTRGPRFLAQCCFGQERAANPGKGRSLGPLLLPPFCRMRCPSTPPDCSNSRGPNFGLSSAQVTLIPSARSLLSPFAPCLPHPPSTLLRLATPF